MQHLQLRFSAVLLRSAATLLLAAGCTLAGAQQRAGEILHLQGMATAQQPGGGAYRFLGKGDPVLAGDVISTTDKGYAVVSLEDGSRFTLRPSTTFALDRFSQQTTQGSSDSLAMRLVKGGMRFVSGLVGKRSPGNVELRVNTATIGIRGTSFDARLCGEDCRQEDVVTAGNSQQVAAAAALPPVVARVVQASGNVTATQPGKEARALGIGSALYEGDAVRSGTGGVAVLGFRDQTRVSVNPETVLRIESFVYNRPQTPSNAVLSLLKGGLRAFTGLIGKNAPSAFSVRTRTSTIGIRGTGMDISCEGPCVDPSVGNVPADPAADLANPRKPDGLFLRTWEGGTYFEVGPLDVPLEQVGFIGHDGVARLLSFVPDFFADFGSPRPDQLEIDWDNLFATLATDGSDGLYVYVRDGSVSLSGDGSRVDMGVGEGGYLSIGGGRAVRIRSIPAFLTTDPYPIPEFFNQSTAPILQLFGVTLGQPGQEICRL